MDAVRLTPLGKVWGACSPRNSPCGDHCVVEPHERQSTLVWTCPRKKIAVFGKVGGRCALGLEVTSTGPGTGRGQAKQSLRQELWTIFQAGFLSCPIYPRREFYLVLRDRYEMRPPESLHDP